MATNTVRWVRNLLGAGEPFVYLGMFQAGSTQAIKRGETLKYVGNATNAWVPCGDDHEGVADVAIANEEIKAGDRAGYYEIIVPRPGDVFEYELEAAGDIAYGANLYTKGSTKMQASGSNIIGHAVGQEHYPQKQGHLTDDAAGDAGTTVRSTTHVRMSFRAACSLWSSLQA